MLILKGTFKQKEVLLPKIWGILNSVASYQTNIGGGGKDPLLIQ